MGMRKKLLVAALGFGLAFSSISVNAKSVYDASNYKQNYTTAQNAIQIAQTEVDHLTQLKQSAINLANSTASLGNLSGIAQTNTELKLFNQLKAADSALLASVTKAMDLNDNLLAQWGSSNMSFDSFCTSISNSSNQRDKDMVSLFQTSTAEMQRASQRRQEILARLGSAVGQTQAIQAVGTLVDVLIGQNQQVIGLMTAKGADSVAEKNEAEAQAKYARQVMREYEARKRSAATGFR